MRGDFQVRESTWDTAGCLVMRSGTAESHAILADSLLNQELLLEIVFQLNMTTFSIGQIYSSSIDTIELTGA